MTQPLPWIFEPCSPEGATDPAGNPWPHAVRGRKPAGRLIHGYGYTEPTAYRDAEQKAQQYDAREMIGQRGEVVAPTITVTSSWGTTVWIDARDWPTSGTVSIPSVFDMMPIGT